METGIGPHLQGRSSAGRIRDRTESALIPHLGPGMRKNLRPIIDPFGSLDHEALHRLVSAQRWNGRPEVAGSSGRVLPCRRVVDSQAPTTKKIPASLSPGESLAAQIKERSPPLDVRSELVRLVARRNKDEALETNGRDASGWVH